MQQRERNDNSAAASHSHTFHSPSSALSPPLLSLPLSVRIDLSDTRQRVSSSVTADEAVTLITLHYKQDLAEPASGLEDITNARELGECVLQSSAVTAAQ